MSDVEETYVSDLGAELSPCKVCGVCSVLMFSCWCNRCREKHPEEFKSQQGVWFGIGKENELS